MLDSIIKFSIKNKLIIGMMTVALMIWGIWSATQLPIDAVPDITNNQVQIITNTPTLASQEVEQLVTYPIEKSMANIPGLIEMRSFSRFGLSVITLVFKEDVDIYFARQLISEQLKSAEKIIPKDLGQPEMAPVTTGLGEIYQYVIHPEKGSDDKYSAMDLRTMQDWIVSRQLYGIEGVAEVTGFGGISKQYEVALNPDRLKALNVSIPEIFTALEKNNENTGGAYIDKKPNAYFIRGIGMVKSINDIENIVIKNAASGIPLLIRDVAKVQLGSPPRYGAMTYNGEKEVVGGLVLMLKGANSNEVVNRVKERMKSIQQSLPADVVIEPYLDRSELVKRAIGTVEKNLVEGALIVIFVLVIFLGNLRAGLIVASAIPLSLLFAFAMMHVFGVSANLMSLGAIDFGLIVDGAVIIVEATLHVLATKKSNTILTGNQKDDIVEMSAGKMMKSAAFGQIIILIVYVPILSLSGIEGKMFTPMAKTVSFAILGALILSLTYIPMMSALFLSKKISHKTGFSDRMMAAFQRMYLPLLQKAIRIKYWLVGGTILIFVLCVFLFKNMGGEFIPTLEEGDYAIEFVLPQGTSLSQTTETVLQAEKMIRQFPEVKMVVGKTGAADVATDPMPMNTTDLMVVLKPKDEWVSTDDFNELAEMMKEKLENIPGVIAEPSQPIQMRFNELMTGVRQDVAIKIFGENLDTLASLAPEVAGVIKDIPGVSDPVVERTTGLPQIAIEYDRARIAGYGLNIEDINHVVETAFAGKTTGQVFENERRFDLVVRLDSAYRNSLENVADLFIPLSNGSQVPLSQVANVSFKEGPAQISREEGKRRIVIGFNVRGRDVQTVVNDIQEKLNSKVKLPTGYYFTYGGQFENLQNASKRLMVAVPVSLLLIFLLLYFTFHSLKQAALIFTAIPMSAIGGVFALLLRGMPFSISAGVGFIALFGVAVLNGIVLIGTFNQLEKDGVANIIKRVTDGTKERLRPVLMTATVASLGFIPMALSQGAGAEVQKPLATVVIGGLMSATFLTLFVLPLLYIIFNSAIKIKPNMKSITLTLIFMLAVSNIPALAQVKVVSSADEAIDIAVKNNLGIKAGYLAVQSAQSLERTAGELPKLNFNTQLGQYSSRQFDNAFQFSQTIPFPGIFKSRKELVKAEVKERELKNELSIVELKNRVRTYYYEVQFLQHKDKQLKYLDSLYDDFIRIAQLRYKTGDTKKTDISTAKAKKGEINLMLLQNGVNLKNAYQYLNALLNIPGSIEIAETDMYRPLQLNEMMDSAVIANHPAIQSLLQDAMIAEQKKQVEKAQFLPDFTLGYTNQSLIGYQLINNEEKYFGPGKRFNYMNVGIAIPLSFGANKARIKSFDFEKQAAQATAMQQQQELFAQLKNVMQQYQQNVMQYRYYQDKALTNADEIIAAARLGYRTGDISYVEYLYALQTATDTRLNYLESIRKINESVITIFSLTNQ